MTDLDTQIKQARQKVRDLQAKAHKQKCRDETRKKVLYGAAILAHLDDVDEKIRLKKLDWLHIKIARKTDRDFLGLSAPFETASERD